MQDAETARIGVIGLGYVGLPLALAFSAGAPVTGFDVDARRVDELRAGHDRTAETDADELAQAQHLTFTTRAEDLAECNVYIVTVPTPVDAMKRPDLTALLSASDTVGSVIAPGDVVIFESTVYPGATEEDCIPVIERRSGLLGRGLKSGEFHSCQPVEGLLASDPASAPGLFRLADLHPLFGARSRSDRASSPERIPSEPRQSPVRALPMAFQLPSEKDDLVEDILARYPTQYPFASMVTHRYPLEQANEALEIVGRWEAAKCVIEPGEHISTP